MLKISRVLAVLLVASSLTYAKEAKDMDVYGNEIVDNGKVVNIYNGVVIEYDGDILSGKSAIYDRVNNKIIIKDNVTVIQKNGKRVRANELTVNLDNDHILFKDFFQIDTDDVWISSVKAKKEEDKLKFKNALFSSCQVDNPDWLIGFDKAVYDTKDKVLKLDDAKIYIKDIPVFYFPYLSIPLGRERKSGFLRPKFAHIEDEGYLFEEPYFWAINKSQDLEFYPQIRTKRGYGLYAMYRFYHDKDAYGSIKAGYFKDKKSYTNKYNLKYNKHYGVEAEYTNKSLIDSLAKGEYENKLYLNGIYFNDGDYINLQNRDYIGHFRIGSYYESRLNYFIKNNYFYSGINFRYFKSVSHPNNDDTIQILPQINFHLPYTNLFYNNLSYSLDTTIVNYTRKKGTKALKLSLKAPLEMHYSLFNNYLSLNLSEEIEATSYKFKNVPKKYDKYNSIIANHEIELASELSKVYDSGIHTALFSLIFTKSNIISESSIKYKDIPNDIKIDFIDKVLTNSKLTFRSHHFWKGFNGFNVDYILDANYYFKDKKIRDLNQEIDIKYKHWHFYSNVNYSFLYKTTTEIYSSISYKRYKYGLTFAYLWEKDYKTLETTSKDLSVDGYYKYSSALSFRASVSYDIKSKSFKNWEVGTNLNRKCWSVDFTFGQDIRPVIKSDGSRGSISNNYFGVQFTILPFGLSYGTGN